ncbi:HRDC domain-containing protein [bacterium]|nr:HRDC domain-containing protein [bacterium]
MATSERTLIRTRGELSELCQLLRQSSRIAFDTEFIPERTYTPELCLIQVATPDFVQAIDTIAVPHLNEFWSVLVETDAEIVVHAGRQEMEFCVAATQALPKRIVDVQLAAGFVGLGYPTSYTNLVQRALNVDVKSTETRTDWRRRPLTHQQIEYALDDVRYLLASWDEIAGRLDQLSRRAWYEDELRQTSATLLEDPAARFRRVPGAGGLRPRGLAVLRELITWREERARMLNRPPRWIMRDDILTELAKRQPQSIDDLRSSRGLGLDSKNNWAKEVLAAIARGLEVPESELPRPTGRRDTTEEMMVVKILAAAMIQRAGEVGVATSLIGTNEDLRDVLDWYRREPAQTELPPLLEGWREQVAGKFLLQLLSGEVVARITAKRDDVQLHFEPFRPVSS